MKTNTEMETLGGFPYLPAMVRRPTGRRRSRPAPHATMKSGLLLAVLAMPAVALAAEGSADRELPNLGLSPGDPQVRSPTPSVPFGIRPAEAKENTLDFHGYLFMPAHVGLHERDTTTVGQSGTVLHSPPLMAQDLRGFEYTGVVPAPWLQMNFLYGNSTLYATAILAGTSAMDGSGYFNPVDQFGVNDAFVTANLTKTFGFPFQLNVGAFTGRYGAMGAWDAGRYGTPLIARTNTIGENITTGYRFGEVFLVLEQGLGGQIGRPPAGLVSAGWNDYTNANVGATFVNHAHLGLSYAGLVRFGLHYLTAWTQDDVINGGQMPDGRITVLGADLQITAKRAGHLYLGGAWTKATNASTVSGAIEILNARGGPELIKAYLYPGSNSSQVCPPGRTVCGDGSLSTFGAQYDLSVARLVFGDLYQGMSPDILVSLFGVGTYVKSHDDPTADGVFKVKGGGEATYLPLSWFGVSERFDHVRLHGSDSKYAFNIISSRLLFHMDWKSRGELALQYSHFIYGSSVQVMSGYDPATAQPVNPDHDVFSLMATYWW